MIEAYRCPIVTGVPITHCSRRPNL
jgi:hypothetical protein